MSVVVNFIESRDLSVFELLLDDNGQVDLNRISAFKGPYQEQVRYRIAEDAAATLVQTAPDTLWSLVRAGRLGIDHKPMVEGIAKTSLNSNQFQAVVGLLSNYICSGFLTEESHHRARWGCSSNATDTRVLNSASLCFQTKNKPAVPAMKRISSLLPSCEFMYCYRTEIRPDLSAKLMFKNGSLIHQEAPLSL